MATDFFQRQSDARRSTLWLTSMFILAVIAIVTAVAVIAWILVQTQMKEPGQPFSRHPEQVLVPLAAAAVTLCIILGGSLFKVVDLRRGGGTKVAESLGGKRLYPSSQDRVERRLLNVVEEMAIASGTPVPPVFLLEEPGINAFAAGYTPSDAVLGVTRGCAEQLSRDELQGVIAHEFSHVLNGDMRMSIRLIGVLHGILLIGLTGQLIFRIFFYSGSGRSRRSGKDSGQAVLAIMAIGLALIVLGFIGTFFGNLIKAAVSRQREYLADASAVQFTRNPSGIAGALKRIGGFSSGSRLKAPAAAQASHMYFSQGVWEGFSGLWATHPPLDKRIRAIEPNWNGEFLKHRSTTGQPVDGAAGFFAGDVGNASEVPVVLMDHALDSVGHPTHEHQHYASELIASLPAVILETAREPYGARAVVYGLLLDKQADIRQRQREILERHAAADVVRLVSKLQATIDGLSARVRLPLIDMCLPALRAMTAEQFKAFRKCFVELAKADEQIDLFEWMLSQVLMRHLQSQFDVIHEPRTNYYGLQRLRSECGLLLSIVAAAGNTPEVARAAFQRGAAHLPELKLEQQPRSSRGLEALREVLAKLSHVSSKQRGRLVDACAAAICADQHVTWQEAELLRGISDLLDCPMPPLLEKRTAPA